MTATTITPHEARAHALAEKLIGFLETSEVPDGLFSAGMFCDFTNASAVVCVGVVEDYLWRAAVVSTDPRSACGSTARR